MTPVMLIVLDGWGINEHREGNAEILANTPALHKIFKEYPNTKLETSGLSVGLPDGQMGNSEVGHLTIGAGRIVYQELTRINREIETGDFFKNKTLLEAMTVIKKSDRSLHLIGLVSDGGVHSHTNHLFALLDMAKKQGLDMVFIHAFLDGRDTPPTSGKAYIEGLQAYIDKIGISRIATISGRFYAMDRDNRWERVEKAYNAIVRGEGRLCRDTIEAITQAGETDEFVMPTVILNNNKPTAVIKDGDSVIFFNFRADRAREITKAITQDGFNEFNRISPPLRLSAYVCLTEYDAVFNLPVAFPPQSLNNILGEVLSKNNIKQLRLAETEKYAHVTFFFNGGIEKPFYLEDRLLIPSPRDVPTYDKKPEMSAYLITEELIKGIKQGDYKFILVNYANGDMVGHTGVLQAAIKACEVIDECIDRVVSNALENGWSVLITSDHGNIEQMIDSSRNEPHTAHTTNPAPFILIDNQSKKISLRKGGLSDIAPTVLDLMGIKKPMEMTGNSLIMTEQPLSKTV